MFNKLIIILNESTLDISVTYPLRNVTKIKYKTNYLLIVLKDKIQTSI